MNTFRRKSITNRNSTTTAPHIRIVQRLQESLAWTMIKSRLMVQSCHRQTQRILARDVRRRLRPLPGEWNVSGRTNPSNHFATRSFWSILSSFSTVKEEEAVREKAVTQSNQKIRRNTWKNDGVDRLGGTAAQRQRDELEEKNEKMPQVQQLLDLKKNPIGSFRASTWMEAEACLRWVVEERQDMPLSFSLLDRLVQEPEARQVLTQDLLYSVVHMWGITYMRRQEQLLLDRRPGNGASSASEARTDSSKGTRYDRYSLPPPHAVWQKLEAYQDYGMQLDNRMCYHVIEGASVTLCRKKTLRYPELAELILDRMLHKSRHENPLMRPTAGTFNAVIASWQAVAQIHPTVAQERSHALLRRLKSLYEAGWGQEFIPDHMTYRRVMSQYAHKGDGETVEELLEELYDLYTETGQQHSTLQPGLHHFTFVLIAWSKSKDPDAPQRATAILERMLELEALSTGNKKASAVVVNDHDQGKSDEENDLPQFFGFKVYPTNFNIVMHCWSKQRTKEAAFEVQRIYDQLMELFRTDPRTKRPNGGTYSALIMAWHRFDPAKAEQYFWEWKDKHGQGLCDSPTDGRSMFNILVDGWYHSKVPDAAERCENLFLRVLEDDTGELNNFWQPSGIAFSMVISAWTRKKERKDVEQAESMLIKLEDYIQKQQRIIDHGEPPASWLASLGASPTLIIKAYIPVIHGFAALGEPERADNLMRNWFGLYKHKTDIFSPSFSRGDHKQNKQLYDGTVKKVLNSWLTKAATQPDAADRAEDLLLSMREWKIKPNAPMFDTVLECRRRGHRSIGIPAISPRVDELIDFLDVLLSRGRDSSKQRKASFLSIRRLLSEEGNR
jgi:hypothetical protein